MILNLLRCALHFDYMCAIVVAKRQLSPCIDSWPFFSSRLFFIFFQLNQFTFFTLSFYMCYETPCLSSCLLYFTFSISLFLHPSSHPITPFLATFLVKFFLPIYCEQSNHILFNVHTDCLAHESCKPPTLTNWSIFLLYYFTSFIATYTATYVITFLVITQPAQVIFLHDYACVFCIHGTFVWMVPTFNNSFSISLFLFC